MSDTVNYCSCVHKGTFTYPDGENYVGDYKDGKRTGRGIFTFKNGNGPSFIDLDVKHCGAIIEVVWPRTKIDARRGENSISMDQKNKPIQI